eukprot:scaffold29214_cov43-Phaeocystis_antarctica.AAC.2
MSEVSPARRPRSSRAAGRAAAASPCSRYKPASPRPAPPRPACPPSARRARGAARRGPRASPG